MSECIKHDNIWLHSDPLYHLLKALGLPDCEIYAAAEEAAKLENAGESRKIAHGHATGGAVTE